MELLKICTTGMIFLTGFLSCLLVIMAFGNQEVDFPFGIGGQGNGNTEAPGDWVKQSQVKVYDNAVVINVDDASLSRYADTGSMKPVLDEYSTGIRIVPENPQDINVGDIITFEDEQNELIIHRVVEKGEDEQGEWFVTKGDNNNVTDGKIRFEQIKYVTIGILW